MISLEAHRAKIGSFLSRARKIQSNSADLGHRYNESNIFSNSSFSNHAYSLQVFGFSIIILTWRLNLNFACLKLLRLLEDGDIESNPGPRSFKIAKFVQGSFHQGHVKFGQTAGIQCACNALFALCWSTVKRVTIWKTMDMDYILEKGDELYKSLNMHIPLNIDELPQHVNIEGCLLTVRLLSQQQGNISSNVMNKFLKVSY